MIFGRKSIDTIMVGFTKTIDDLKNHLAQNDRSIGEKQASIGRLNEEVTALESDSNRATRILGKLNEIVE